MERLTRLASTAFVGVAGLVLVALPVEAQEPRVSASGLQARISSGTISGTVIDDRGGVLEGAMVSALGVTLVSTVTDERGRFALNQLPPGDYLLRAHMAGFAASTGTRVQVGLAPAVQHLELRRLDVPTGTAGTAPAPLRTRPILAAGFALPSVVAEEPADEGETDKGDHPHDEAAWRLRHIKRSILKNTGSVVMVTDPDPLVPSGSLFGRAVGSAANLATSLFTDFPFSGEVNFLTTSAVAPGAVLSATALPRGVAYVALAAPAPGGDWAIRAAMSEGDLSSWIVAGSFASRREGRHVYDFGLSYSTQEYIGGNPSALAAVTDGSRNVGELYAFDTWSITRAIALDYGGRYAHHDYLENRGLLSPRVGVTLGAPAGLRIRGSAVQRMVAPGAEEFLATSAAGPWLPPERTFAPLRDAGSPDAFRVERARAYDLRVERNFGDAIIVGIGRFYQSVDDQLVTLFGLQMPGGPQSVGHYYVGSVGSVDAGGWQVRLDARPSSRIQGSVYYSVTRAEWRAGGDRLALASLAPAAIRPDVEELHDVTSSVEADIRETATKVFLLYKVNSGFVRSNAALARPGLDGRFELQVNQALPVTFMGTRWEVLVGLRNLFRDAADPASVYDELLVVGPPKRFVGGVLVKF
jgi:hypothetical protein